MSISKLWQSATQYLAEPKCRQKKRRRLIWRKYWWLPAAFFFMMFLGSHVGYAFKGGAQLWPAVSSVASVISGLIAFAALQNSTISALSSREALKEAQRANRRGIDTYRLEYRPWVSISAETKETAGGKKDVLGIENWSIPVAITMKNTGKVLARNIQPFSVQAALFPITSAKVIQAAIIDQREGALKWFKPEGHAIFPGMGDSVSKSIDIPFNELEAAFTADPKSTINFFSTVIYQGADSNVIHYTTFRFSIRMISGSTIGGVMQWHTAVWGISTVGSLEVDQHP